MALEIVRTQQFLATAERVGKNLAKVQDYLLADKNEDHHVMACTVLAVAEHTGLPVAELIRLPLSIKGK